MPTALAVSPHLDDAVFSAGGTLHRLTREGWRVVVATVFTANVASPRGFALSCQLDKGLAPDVDYMALRRAEDAAACRVLGAEPIWLPFLEAPHRGYESAAALFAGLRTADAVVDEITPRIARLVDEAAPDLVLGPQCIGGHVDHVAVHLALRACRRPLRLWADFPYASRRKEVAASPFSHNFVADTLSEVALLATDRSAKIKAACCYVTQLGFQFGGLASAETCIASVGANERFVQFSDKSSGDE